MLQKIDIHIHVRLFKGIGRISTGTTYATPEEIQEKYQQLGIEKGVILPGVSPECSLQPQSNEEVMALVEKYPQLFYWFCNIDPRIGQNSPDTNLSYYLQYYKERGARGVGEITANLHFDDPYMENLFYHCEKCDMPVLFHMASQQGGTYGLIDEIGLKRLEKELKQFPKLKFIGHSQVFWAEISTDVTPENRNDYPSGKVTPGRVVELMRQYDNLYCDLSAGSGYNAVSRDAEFGYTFLEEFQDRLFFGTDICAPENDMKLSHWLDNAVKDGKITESAYKKISRENAMKILK